MTKQNTTKSFVACLKCSNYSVAFQVSCHLRSEQISKNIACLSETQSDNFFTWMAESKNFNWIRNDGSTNLKTRQVKTNLHFSVEHKVYIHETFPAKTTSFWLDALMFLYRCLQRIIMLLFLLNTPRCYQFKLEQTHIIKCTCEHKNSKTEAHTSKHKLWKRADKNQHFFKHLFVFNVFTSFNLLRKSEVLQAFQRPWPLGFILLYLLFKLHFCSLTFWLCPASFVYGRPCIASRVYASASCEAYAHYERRTSQGWGKYFAVIGR